MLGLGTPELVVILVIILLLFGGTQLPKLARSFGSAAKELRDGLENGDKTSSKSDKAKKTTKE